MEYKKHFTALESNPDLFTTLVQELGLSQQVCFHDVWSLSEPELLATVPRPVLALVLVFPTTDNYEANLAAENSGYSTIADAPSAQDDGIFWLKQTINNACGLYGILHAVTNGVAREYMKPDSYLSRLVHKLVPLTDSDRASALENEAELEAAYNKVAVLGDTEPPEDPEEEVDFHYVCFVKGGPSGNVYMLDGDRKGPIQCGRIPEGHDLFCEKGLEIIKDFMQKHDENGQFSLLALAPDTEETSCRLTRDVFTNSSIEVGKDIQLL
ncbi:unnamed protein product [Clonostachys rosea]|uniref:Ubiquitin carboxyl-terminal hydrolase n=1 Tax=Bionectria ochroleuca TaxID=29856 RepID=A0ABY6ULX6_BIOOC|nr:unnamed protein product [Clonostachys rosea]